MSSPVFVLGEKVVESLRSLISDLLGFKSVQLAYVTFLRVSDIHVVKSEGFASTSLIRLLVMVVPGDCVTLDDLTAALLEQVASRLGGTGPLSHLLGLVEAGIGRRACIQVV